MFRRFTALIGAFFLLLVGCQEEPSANPSAPGSKAESFSHQISRPTEYYTGGPQQARPPDGQFSAGTRISILQEAGSYTRVRSESGIEAYVSSGAIQDLP